METEALIPEFPAEEEREEPIREVDGADAEAQVSAEEKEEPSDEQAAEESDFAELASRDLRELRDAIPALHDATDLTVLSDPHRYGELREAGLTPLEAYYATEGQRLLGRRADNRAHLASSVGRFASARGGRIGAAELYAARDLFPSLSDGEIEALWRRVEHPARR